jgi:hypothetical protein
MESGMTLDFIIVGLLAASPVGEELISIPVGYAEGLPLFAVAIVSIFCNFIPVPLILWLGESAGKHPYLERFLGFFRRKWAIELVEKYGFLAIVFLGPITGVYSMAVTVWVFGMGTAKSKILLSFMVGLILYAAGICAIIVLGKKAWAVYL